MLTSSITNFPYLGPLIPIFKFGSFFQNSYGTTKIYKVPEPGLSTGGADFLREKRGGKSFFLERKKGTKTFFERKKRVGTFSEGKKWGKSFFHCKT